MSHQTVGTVPQQESPVRQLPESLLATSEEEVEGRFYLWLVAEAGPDDWHRFALGANWDSHGTDVFEWIAGQPYCDKATALTLFWKASPDYAVEFAEDAYEHRGLIGLVRERWMAGGYVRSELAFDVAVDVHLPDFERLRTMVGARVDQELPSSMRQSLPGRRLDADDDIEGMPSRFWPEELR